MTDNNLEKLFTIRLNLTIPLLIKHNISAVPTNYAIWYNYASYWSPELKSSTDHVLEYKKALYEAKRLDIIVSC
ncbi:MAG: diguanylate cyclase [Congregibacter sp.]|jgi:diguanylate cyclase